MSVDQATRLRAAEIVQKSDRPITLAEAYETVYRERYGDDVKSILKALAQLATSASRALATSTHILPDTNDSQLAMFDTPAVIAVSTPDGPLFIPRDLANGHQVKQWLQEGHRHHATQKYRFRNGLKDVEALDESELDQAWPDLRPILIERKQKMIEGSS